MAKIPSLRTLVAGSHEVQIDRAPRPAAGRHADHEAVRVGFFGTALSSLLAAEGCDTVLVTGATTSGCVRATAVDAVQHGYRPIVPRECVGDRAQAPHEANLFDIQQKYGDVVEPRRGARRRRRALRLGAGGLPLAPWAGRSPRSS